LRRERERAERRWWDEGYAAAAAAAVGGEELDAVRGEEVEVQGACVWCVSGLSAWVDAGQGVVCLLELGKPG
jgi:hypothetical protein